MEFTPIGASLCEQRPWLILVAFVLSQLLVAHLQPPKWLSFGYHIFVGYWVRAYVWRVPMFCGRTQCVVIGL